MLTDIIDDFARRMESRVAELTAEFTRTLGFAGLEAGAFPKYDTRLVGVKKLAR